MRAQHNRNFSIDLDLGEVAEKKLAKVLQNRLKGVKAIQKMDHKKAPYDLLITIEREDGTTFDRTIEVKSLEGRYDTGVVEIWADDAKTKRPHWFSDKVDIVVFQDRSRDKWFFYDAQSVIKHLTNWSGRLTRAANPCEDDSGWLAKFYWNPNDNLGPFAIPHYQMEGFLYEL